MAVLKHNADRCMTHHHACDCREYHFQELEGENQRLREALQEIYNSDHLGNGWARFKAEQALAQGVE